MKLLCFLESNIEYEKYMNELSAVKKPSVFKRNLIAKVKFLTELCYCMNSADSIAQIAEKVDDTIQLNNY